MLGFFPRRIPARGVVDPERLAAEFIEAEKVASHAGPFQWLDGAFPPGSRANFEPFNHVWVRTESTSAASGTTDSQPAQIGAGVGDANLWYIPYNAGFSEVGDGDCAVEWTSEYPELVLIAFSFQYMRLDIEEFPDYDPLVDSTHRHIRTQLMLQVDGARVPGTGPYGPMQSSWRTTGLGTRAARSTLWTVQFLPAGPHRITAVGAQTPCLPITDDTKMDGAQAIDDNIENGVAIGHRRMLVIGAPRAMRMGV